MNKKPKFIFQNLWSCGDYYFEFTLSLYIEIFGIYIDFYKINLTILGFNLGFWYYQ